MYKTTSTRICQENLLAPLIPIEDEAIPDPYKPNQVPEDFDMKMIKNKGRCMISYSGCHLYTNRFFIGPLEVLYHDPNNWIQPFPIPEELYPWIQNFEIISMPKDSTDQ